VINIKNKNYFTLYNFISISFALEALLLLNPYFLWHSSPILYRLIAFFALILSLYYFFKQRKISNTTIIIANTFILSILIRQFSSFENVSHFSIMLILGITFLLLNNEIQKKVFLVFLNIYVLTLIPALILYVLIAIGAPLEWTLLEGTNAGKVAHGLYYREYFGMVVLSDQIFPFMSGELFRLSALYDEPGVVGTISALLLAATQFNMKNLKGKILLISGVLSFSLAFYIMAFIYLAITRVQIIVGSVIFLSIAIVFLPTEFKDNKLINYYVTDRVYNVFSDFDSVNNRTNPCFEVPYNNFLSSNNILLGMGHKAAVNLGCGVASYKVLIYDYGIFGIFMISIFYIVILLKIKYKYQFIQLIPFFIVALASSYQRPAVDKLWFIIIFMGAILLIVETTKKTIEYKYIEERTK
jgi:hypothetical protein